MKERSVAKYNLAFEQELPTKGVIVSAEGIQVGANNLIN